VHNSKVFLTWQDFFLAGLSFYGNFLYYWLEKSSSEESASRPCPFPAFLEIVLTMEPFAK
jgi:hypothetical protein